MDIDPAEIDKNVNTEAAIIGNVKNSLPMLTKKIKKNNHESWIKEFKDAAEIEYNKVIKDALHPKSGKLLKKMELSNVTKTQGRWYPQKMVFKDMLKQGDGTEFIITEIQFDVEIPEYIFTKAALKK